MWEFSITMKDGCHAVIFLTEDARQVGCCYQEVLPGRVPQARVRKVKYVAIRVLDFNHWLGFPKEREVTEDAWGFYTLGNREHGLLPDLRRWCHRGRRQPCARSDRLRPLRPRLARGHGAVSDLRPGHVR